MRISEKDYLTHTGTMGMHWGVRKLEQQHGEIIVKKGALLSHVTSDPRLTLKKDALYLSFTEKDRLNYRTWYASQIQGMRNVNKVFDYKLTAAVDLVTPNAKRRVDEFIALHKSDAHIVKEMGKTNANLSVAFIFAAKYLGIGTAEKRAEEFRRQANSNNPKDKDKVYRSFAMLIAASPELRKKYFERLSKEGFNSIYDDNDMLSGYAQKPLIVFDPTKSLKLGGSEALNNKQFQTDMAKLNKMGG